MHFKNLVLSIVFILSLFKKNLKDIVSIRWVQCSMLLCAQWLGNFWETQIKASNFVVRLNSEHVKFYDNIRRGILVVELISLKRGNSFSLSEHSKFSNWKEPASQSYRQSMRTG